MSWHKKLPEGYDRLSKEYTAWASMLTRCRNPKVRMYYRYGGRGIKVCARWSGEDGYVNFFDDMGKAPTKKHTLDRIDNNKDYGPNNCRWATMYEQARNHSRNTIVTFKGEVMCMQDAILKAGLKSSTVHMRIHARGWSVEKALTTPVMTGKV